MKLYKTNKVALAFRKNPMRFLIGITTNDLDKPQNAFVDIHGKIVTTFDQVKVNDNEFLVIIERSMLDILLEHIDKYVEISGVQIEETNHIVYFDLVGNAAPSVDEIIIPQEMGRLIVSDNELEAAVSEEEYTLFRLKYEIPLQGVDYTNDFILNVDEKAFVSYDKGCFLGQEPISKVHNRSKPTWRLVVKYEDQCTDQQKEKLTSRVVDPFSQKIMGFVFEKND